MGCAGVLQGDSESGRDSPRGVRAGFKPAASAVPPPRLRGESRYESGVLAPAHPSLSASSTPTSSRSAADRGVHRLSDLAAQLVADVSVHSHRRVDRGVRVSSSSQLWAQRSPPAGVARSTPPSCVVVFGARSGSRTVLAAAVSHGPPEPLQINVIQDAEHFTVIAPASRDRGHPRDV